MRGNIAYTTTWGFRAASGNAINIWDVAGDVPTLLNTVIVPNASTLGDVQTSDDGQLLIVATELSPGSIMIYSLADPVNPQLITRYSTALTNPGVHTAEVQRVNGRLYAFLSIDPSSSAQARLVVVDITDPAAPTQAFTAVMGCAFRARRIRPQWDSLHRALESGDSDLGHRWRRQRLGLQSVDAGNPARLSTARPTTSGGITTRLLERSGMHSSVRRGRVPSAPRRAATSTSSTSATSRRRRRLLSSTSTALGPTTSPSTNSAGSSTRLTTTGA